VNHAHRAVVVAVIAVRMMEMPGNQIIDVIAMGNRLVAATRPMDVPRFVAAALVAGRTNVRIVLADGDRMLCGVAIFLVAQAAVVQIVDMSLVFDLDMPAGGTVLVVVFRRLSWLGHIFSFPVRRQTKPILHRPDPRSMPEPLPAA
jgi:hypothetical protein